eukprot:jgi/Tetstr1/423699/TSEL_014333.t1
MLNTSRSVDTSEGNWMVALEFYTPLLCTKNPADQPHSVALACLTLVDSDDRHILGHLGKSYRLGEESMYEQRFSIKPGSRDVAGHELRVSIDSLTELHLQLRDAVRLALLNPLEFQLGYVMSTHFCRGPIEVFLENVSAIHRDAGRSSLGRRLLENSWVDFAGVGADSDAELQAFISVLIKPEMTISSALLYVNSTNTIPGTSTADTTSGISGSNLTWEYDVRAPNAARYFWVELIDNNANSSITPLGVYTTEDNTPPTLDSGVVLGTPPTTSLRVVLDTIGDAFAGDTTSHTYTGLTPNTTYYAWAMAKD